MATRNKQGLYMQVFVCMCTMIFGASLVDKRTSSILVCLNIQDTRFMLCLQDGGTHTYNIDTPTRSSPNVLSIGSSANSLFKRRIYSNFGNAARALQGKKHFSDQSDRISGDTSVAKRPFDSISYNVGLGGGLNGRGSFKYFGR